MKRLVCLFLTLALCLAAFSAVAEGLSKDAVLGVDSQFAGDDVGLKLSTDVKLPEVTLKEESRAGGAADTVVNQNGVYSIHTPTGKNITLNASSLNTFVVLTQSYYASVDIYSRFDPESAANEYIQNLVDHNIHIVIWDIYDAFDYILVRTAGSSGLTQHVGNMSSLSQADLEAVCSQIAIDNEFTSYSLYSFNGNTWMQLGANLLVTIVNGEFEVVEYMPKGDKMTDDDYNDFTTFMRALTVS